MSIPLSNPAERYAAPLSHLEIHLDLVRWNYLSLQKRLRKGSDCAAVVKADAYGLGAAAVAPELYKANCRHFYVAHAGEGASVREALSSLGDAHIYVFHGPYAMSVEDFIKQNLTPVLNTPGDIEYWAGAAKARGMRLPAVIHIDTGMNRLGLSGNEATLLKSNPDILKPLDVRYVMSHLACADVADDPKNAEQLEKFQLLAAQLGVPCRFSFANSAGIFLGPDYHFDQARPGCAIYGINPQATPHNPMRGVVTLKSRILQIRDTSKGETVGYGASYRVPSPAKLATISSGYADGYLRSFTGNGTVYINGQKCPVVGRVSMDTVVADVTHVGQPPHAGGWAELIGAGRTVDDLAAEAKTIGYEILTSLGRRYERIYSGQETI